MVLTERHFLQLLYVFREHYARMEQSFLNFNVNSLAHTPAKL